MTTTHPLEITVNPGRTITIRLHGDDRMNFTTVGKRRHYAVLEYRATSRHVTPDDANSPMYVAFVGIVGTTDDLDTARRMGRLAGEYAPHDVRTAILDTTTGAVTA
jgi:hypothetical protein